MTGAPHSRSNATDIETLVERFIEELQTGESPTIEQYAVANPELAEEIRDLFPTILDVETLSRHKLSTRSVQEPAVDRIPQQLNDFRIIRQIGRGGMGVVYEADQLSLKRRVAIKVLPKGYFNKPGRRTQFHREAQIAGRLHHTNIVPVHGIGSDAGFDFFVMQYIDGVSLDKWIASNNSSDEPMNWRRVARVGIQAARALHYAHEQGVLHRDIKPANLLLFSEGCGEHERIWITDFGLAVAREHHSSREGIGGTPGTLRYMPPEQLAGQPTAQSDIYSLGLTLYELLTGHPAFDDSSPAGLVRRIRQGEKPLLPKHNKTVPYDLKIIIFKATECDPNRRYDTAEHLADDLERLLQHRPIRARYVPPWEHTTRWMKRNPLAAALSVIAIGLLVGVITTTTFGYISAKAGEQRETALRESEQEQRLSEVKQRQRAEAALQVAMESLEELFTQIEANRRPGQRLAPSEARGMLDALERMLKFYEQLADQGQTGPESEVRMAEALRRKGDLHRNLHEYEDAERALLNAILLLERLISETPDEVEPRIQHARAHYTLGRIYRDMKRDDEGDVLIQRAISELEALPQDAPQRRHIEGLLGRFRKGGTSSF